MSPRSAPSASLHRGRVAAAVVGVVSAALALGVGELVAGLDSRLRSPVETVAAQTIDMAPLPLERFAIETFGSNDKLVLVVGILVFCLVFAMTLGIVARRRPLVGPLGIAGFALAGAAAALARPGTGAAVVLPSLVAGVVGIACFQVLGRRALGRASEQSSTNSGRSHGTSRPDDTSAPQDGGGEASAGVVPIARGGMGDRRMFLGLTSAAAVTAVVAAAGGRALRQRFSAAQSRARVRLPAAARPLPALPADVELGVDGVAPFVTPNADFYRVDTALLVPQVRAEDWTLRVTGMVDHPLELSYAELTGQDLVEADITMTCVSNPVGGDLVGHARWLGVLARDLLGDARPRRGADQLVGRSVDGYTCGFPLDAAYDRDCLVAVGMNGEPLPLRHGFPARLVTPGLYGYIGSTKWLTELEVTTFDAFDQYWVRRGYADRAPIKTMARIDTPRSLARITPGPTVVAGVAWAQTRGIEAVEVRIDDGDFEPAQLAEAFGDDTWRQWRFDWDAVPGRPTLTVRAVDGTGETQTEQRADVVPDGASGWMSLVVLVEDQQ